MTAIEIITRYMQLLNDVNLARQAALIAIDTVRNHVGNSAELDYIQSEIERYQRKEPKGVNII